MSAAVLASSCSSSGLCLIDIVARGLSASALGLCRRRALPSARVRSVYQGLNSPPFFGNLLDAPPANGARQAHCPDSS